MEYNIKRKMLRGKIGSIYSAQKQLCKKRGYELPKYTLQEFIGYCKSSDKFLMLHKNWVDSGFEKDLAPSIDRLDDYKTYSFDNIRVCTWKENNKKFDEYRKIGKNNKQSKAVLQFDLDGNFIKELHSCSEAGRSIGKGYKMISSCCLHKCKTAYNYKWGYKNN